MSKCLKELYSSEYAFGAKILRLSFGILFVLVALKKLRLGYTGYADGLIAGRGLLATEFPEMILYLYGLALPAAEMIAGILLLTNRHVQEGYALIGIMYLTFVFGQMYDGNTAKVGTEYMPSLIALTMAVFFEWRVRGKKGWS
jgi:hypothetical protein